jgi:fatty acid desaturase
MQARHDYKSKLDKCVIRINNDAYDVTAWRHSHPGGAELLDAFNGVDATDAFWAFHGEESWAKLKRMKSRPLADTEMPRDELSLKFDRDVRQKLIREGYWKRNWLIDFALIIAPTTLLCVIGTWLAFTHPITATLMIGLGMQQAGWMAHDYCHGLGKGCKLVGLLYGCIAGGFSPSWWNHKHNTHHTFPNRIDHDSDVHNQPVLHLWVPEEGKDTPLRHFQHYYYLAAFSFLYASWRLQSIQHVLASKNWTERVLLTVGYMWLAYLPLAVSIGAMLLGGFLVAVIVTANHQTEEILDADAPWNFTVDQYKTTRGVHTPDPFTFYLFGGMQYQLEHHMFPSMPRYYTWLTRPLIKQFAKENDLPCHVSGVLEILKMNFDVMVKFSADNQELVRKSKH